MHANQSSASTVQFAMTYHMKVGGIRTGGVPRPLPRQRGCPVWEVGVAVAGEVGTRIGEGGVVLRACVHNNDGLFF